MNPKRLAILALISCITLSFVSCSDDDDTTTPPGDTTPPLVVSIDPAQDATGVATSEEITIIFNEPMDPASGPGNVGLTSGSVTSVTWDDDRTMRVGHTGWAEGAEVTVTILTGLKDVAGNNLAAEATSRFWTMTSVVSLLSTVPADLATDVVRNSTVQMLFSHRMNLTSLAAATVATATIPPSPGVTAGAGPAVDLTFTLDNGEDNWVILSFDSELPASSEVDIMVGTGAQSEGGANLGTAASFKFTTGTDLDNEPPVLVSVEPANGSTISPNTGFIRFTFDEPLDIDEFTPTKIGAQFGQLIGSATWSNNNSVVTVPLPTPLPDGLPIVVEFTTYRDVAGNIQTTPIEYAATVSGTPDYFPAVDGTEFTFDVHWVERDSTGAITNEAEGVEYAGTTVVSASEFNMVEYEDETFTTDRGWESYEDVGSAINFTGFTEKDGMDTETFTFVPPVTYMKLPWTPQSWNGVSEAQTTGGSFDVTWAMTVNGPEDVQARNLSGPIDSGRVWWIGCYKLVLAFELSMGGTPQQSGTQTMWYAPTVGLVQQENDEDRDGGGSEQSEHYLQLDEN